MKSDNFNNYVLYILLGILIVGGIGYVSRDIFKTLRQESDFEKREINGTLINIEDLGRDKSLLTIKQSNKQDTLQYHLFINTFIKDHGIKINDSISKTSNSFSATFYKKVDNKYVRCCKYGD